MKKVDYLLELTWNCPQCKWIHREEINLHMIKNLDTIFSSCDECNCEVEFNRCVSAQDGIKIGIPQGNKAILRKVDAELN